MPLGTTAPSAREVGWAAFETPEARAVSARKARIAVIVLALQVVVLQLVLSMVYPEDVHAWVGPLGPLGTSGVLFLILALFYLVFAAILWLRVSVASIFGFILCGASLFAFVSMAESFGIVVGLLFLHDANPRRETSSAA